MKDTFLTISEPVSGYFMNNGSKFYAYAFPVKDETETGLLLQQIKKAHPKATHYCTALRLNPDASVERSADDGEPSGAAGKPILGQLIKHELTHVYVIVVRYFGGTKLGIPGLIEAYRTSTAEAISKATIVEKTVYGIVQMEIPYVGYASFQNFIRQKQILILEEQFSTRVVLKLGFLKSNMRTLLTAALREFSQMDFEDIEDYANHLEFSIRILEDMRVK